MAVKFFKIPDQADILPSTNKKFLITQGAIQVARSTAFNISVGDIELEESIGNSELGTPIMDRIEFPEGSYIDLEGNTITFGGISNATAILEVDQVKNVGKTPIQGRNGTIKEYVSDGDYSITARGFISNTSNIIPLDDLISFKEIMLVPQQIEIVSQYLNEVFDINQIVIESFNMPQIEGFRNQIPFTFQALSDVPLDLEELE